MLLAAALRGLHKHVHAREREEMQITFIEILTRRFKTLLLSKMIACGMIIYVHYCAFSK